MPPSRRTVLTGAIATALAACARPADWCEEPRIVDDGPPEPCAPTAPQVEGPFYLADAPERTDLTEDGDDEILELEGVCRAVDCDTPLAGARIEFWHADGRGRYDNSEASGRYRGHVTTDAEGRWSLRTRMPGRYLNGTTFRPAHIHVKIFDGEQERLTTQIYFEGDEYLECDPIAATSLIIPLSSGRGSFDFLV